MTEMRDELSPADQAIEERKRRIRTYMKIAYSSLWVTTATCLAEAAYLIDHHAEGFHEAGRQAPSAVLLGSTAVSSLIGLGTYFKWRDTAEDLINRMDMRERQIELVVEATEDLIETTKELINGLQAQEGEVEFLEANDEDHDLDTD